MMREKVNIYRIDRTVDNRGIPTDVRNDFRPSTWCEINEVRNTARLTTGEYTTARAYQGKIRFIEGKEVKDLDLVEFRGLTLTIREVTRFDEGRNRYQMLVFQSGTKD